MRGGKLDFFSSSLLYGTPAPSSERQHPEAWPASTYGHLREGCLSVPCELMYRPILSKLANRQLYNLFNLTNIDHYMVRMYSALTAAIMTAQEFLSLMAPHSVTFLTRTCLNVPGHVNVASTNNLLYRRPTGTPHNEEHMIDYIDCNIFFTRHVWS